LLAPSLCDSESVLRVTVGAELLRVSHAALACLPSALFDLLCGHGAIFLDALGAVQRPLDFHLGVNAVPVLLIVVSMPCEPCFSCFGRLCVSLCFLLLQLLCSESYGPVCVALRFAYFGLRRLAVLSALHFLPEFFQPVRDLPDADGRDYATEFVRAYLTSDIQRPELRTQALSRFANNTITSEAGMSPQGSQTVLWAEPVQEQHSPGGGEVVTVAVQTSTVSTPQYVAVPLARNSSGALAVANYPSFVGPPTVDEEYSAPNQTVVSVPGLTAMVTRVVTNYLSDNGQNLQADLVPTAQVSLPTVALTVQHVTSVTWAHANDAVEVQLTAQNSTHSTFALTYLIGVTQQERWYATSIEVNPTSST